MAGVGCACYPCAVRLYWKLALACLLFTAASAYAQPTITNVLITNTTSTTATIQWTTSTASSSLIKYGYDATIPYSNNVDPTLVTSHSMTLTVLNANQPYYFAVVSTDSGGTTQAPTSVFALCGTPLVPVAGTINNYYQYGSYTLTWVPPAGASQSPTVCGLPVQTTVTGSLNSGASFTNQVADAYKIVPGPGYWNVTVTDAGNLAPVTVGAYLSSTTQDVSGQLQAAAAAAGLTGCIHNTITNATFPAGCAGQGQPPGNPLLSFQFNNLGSFAGSQYVGTDANGDLILNSNGSNALTLNGKTSGSTSISESPTGGYTYLGGVQNTVNIPGNLYSPTAGGWRPNLQGVIEDRQYGLAIYTTPEYFCLLTGTPQTCARGLYDEAAAWNQGIKYLADNVTPGYGKVLLVTNTPQGRAFNSTNFLVNGPVSGPGYHGYGAYTTAAQVGLTVTNKQITKCYVSGGSYYAPSANLPVQITDALYEGSGATATVQTNSSGTPIGCAVGLPGMNYSARVRALVIPVGGDGATATVSLSGGVFTVNASNATTTTGSGYAVGTPVGIPVGAGYLQCTTYPTWTAIAAGNLTNTGISTFANTTAGVACTWNGSSTATVPVYFGNVCNFGQCTLAATQTPVQQPCAVAVRSGVKIQGLGNPLIFTQDAFGNKFGPSSIAAFCDPWGDQTLNNNVLTSAGGLANNNNNLYLQGPVEIDGINVNAQIGYDFAGPLSSVKLTNLQFTGRVFMMAPAAVETSSSLGSYLGSNLIQNVTAYSDAGVVCGGYWDSRDPYTWSEGSLGGAYWLYRSNTSNALYSPFPSDGYTFSTTSGIQYSTCLNMEYKNYHHSITSQNAIQTTSIGGTGMVLSTTATSGVLTATPTIVTAGTGYYANEVVRIGTTDATVIVTTATGGVPSVIAIQNPGTTATTNASASTSTAYPSVDLYFQHYFWQTQHAPPQATYQGSAMPALFQSGLNCPLGPDAPVQDYLAVDFNFDNTSSSVNYPFNYCFTGIASMAAFQEPRYNYSGNPTSFLRMADITATNEWRGAGIFYADDIRLDWTRYLASAAIADPYRSTLSTLVNNSVYTILSRAAAKGSATDITNISGGFISPTVNALVGGALTTTGLTFRNIGTPQPDQTTAPLVGATLGSTQYGTGAGTATWLPGNTTASKYFFCQTGTGTVSAAPAWCNILGGANTWTATQTFAAIVATQLSGLTSPVTPNAVGGTTVGSAALPFNSVYLGAAATNNFKLTGTATAARTVTFQDASGSPSLQVLYECGTTTTCAKTLQTNPIVQTGTVTLSGGTATVSSLQAYSSTSSMFVTCTDQTSAAAVKCVAASTTSITVTGTSTDVIAYTVVGH